MSFTVVIQNNASEKNRVDKDLTTIVALSGTLKDQSSIINPAILITGDMATFKNANYMTISSFGRSYFIDEIVSVRDDLIRISGHVDVLTSFKSQIRANNAIIKRQKNKWNLYLNDGSFKTYQNPIVITKPFPSGFSGSSYVLAVAGG